MVIFFVSTADNCHAAGNVSHMSAGAEFPSVQPMLKGMKLDPEKPFEFQFLFDASTDCVKEERRLPVLIKYFLTALAIPSEEFWVNLSPYEKDRITTESISKTELGSDLLAMDYVLKQVASSLTHPDTPVGRAYWRIENRSDLISTERGALSKIWIKPGYIEIYEKNKIALITKSELKAEAEEGHDGYDLIVPEVEKRLNEADEFITLRQIYNAVILANWFKKRLRESVYNSMIDTGRAKGIELSDGSAREIIYQQYLSLFQKGAYDLIKKQKDVISGRIEKRRYFCGGADLRRTVTSSMIDLEKAENSIEHSAYMASVIFNTGSSSMEKKDADSDPAQEESNPADFEALSSSGITLYVAIFILSFAGMISTLILDRRLNRLRPTYMQKAKALIKPEYNRDFVSYLRYAAEISDPDRFLAFMQEEIRKHTDNIYIFFGFLNNDVKKGSSAGTRWNDRVKPIIDMCVKLKHNQIIVSLLKQDTAAFKEIMSAVKELEDEEARFLAYLAGKGTGFDLWADIAVIDNYFFKIALNCQYYDLEERFDNLKNIVRQNSSGRAVLRMQDLYHYRSLYPLLSSSSSLRNGGIDFDAIEFDGTPGSSAVESGSGPRSVPAFFDYSFVVTSFRKIEIDKVLAE